VSPTKTRPRCAGCKRRIPAHEPDLLVRKLSPDNPAVVTLAVRFHERCAPAAALGTKLPREDAA
jgi:hypothetical protein